MAIQMMIITFISIIMGQLALSADSNSVHGTNANHRYDLNSLPIESRPNHPQGEIWYLRESGATQEADNLEHIIENVLKNDPIIAPLKHKGAGSSVSYIVQFSNNIFAIMKEADPFVQKSPEYEVVAYRFDRALNMNMVPLTVIRDYQGKKMSLQLIVPTAVNQQYDQIQSFWQIQQENNVLIFDSILLNYDRIVEYMHNLILSTEGRLVAIDHARLMKNVNQTVWREPHELTPEFVNGLIHLDEFRLRQMMGDLIDREDLNKIMMRLKITREMMIRSLKGQPLQKSRTNTSFEKRFPRYEYEVPIQLKSIFKSNTSFRLSCERVFQ